MGDRLADNGIVVEGRQGRPKDARKAYAALALAGAIVLAGILLPESAQLTREGLVSVSVLAVAVLLWVTEAVNANVTALLILALLPTLGALSYVDTFSGLGNRMIWRLVGVMIVTIGLNKSGLDRRMALHALRLARGNVYAMLLLMVVLAQVLVFLVPVPQARTSLLATTYLGILQGLRIRPPSNIGKIIFIGIPAFTVLTSAATITGASVEVYAVGLFSTLLGYDFTYLSWMLANLPVTFLACFLILPGLILLFPPETRHIEGADALASTELGRMGSLNAAERKMLAVFTILAVMWFSNAAEAIPAELLMAAVLFLPGVKLITWSDAQLDVPWGTVILFGSSLALATALQANGVIEWAAETSLAMIGTPVPLAAAIMIFVLATIVRLGMTNMTGVVAALFPLTVAMAPAMNVNPVWLGLVCVLASAMGVFFPSQNASYLLTYAFDYYSTSDMAKAGLVIFAVFLVTVLVLGMFYWPLVGIPILNR